MKSCLFAGSFDPFTTGHRAVVERCLREYDKVYVVAMVNAKKTPLFSKEEKIEIISQSLINLDMSRIEISFFEGYLVDFMQSKEIDDNVRGIRNDTDLEYEKKMEKINKTIYPNLSTVYLRIEGYEGINSTSVREGLLGENANYNGVCESAVKKVQEILKTKGLIK